MARPHASRLEQHGAVSERFLTDATRFVLDHCLAQPGVIADNYYKELTRR